MVASALSINPLTNYFFAIPEYEFPVAMWNALIVDFALVFLLDVTFWEIEV